MLALAGNVTGPVTWEGLDAATLATQLNLPRLEVHQAVDSTQDVAHQLAGQGAPPGTVVLADAQRAGRGRMGRSWSSEPGAGVWVTVVERPDDSSALDVLSIRVGLALAGALQPFAPGAIGLKWPNDLIVGGEKLGGILVEARWTGQRLGWVAVGVGINVRRPPVAGAVGLAPGTGRVEVLHAVTGAVRAAAQRRGWLTSAELDDYRARDVLAGRRITLPVTGQVVGITPAGALEVESHDGAGRQTCRTGTIQLAEEP